MLWTTYLTTVFVHTVYAWTMTDPSLVFLGPPRRGGSVPKRFEAINDQTQCHVGPRDEKEESVTRIHKNSLSQFWCLIPRCGHKDVTLDSTRFNQMILVRLDWFIWCCGPHFVVSQSVFLVLLLWSFGTGSATIGQAVSEQQPPPRFWSNSGKKLWCSMCTGYIRVPSWTALPVEYGQVYACMNAKKRRSQHFSCSKIRRELH